MHRSPRARFAAASLAVMALALAACGDDDDDTSGTEITSVEDTTDLTSETTGTTDDTADETTDGTTGATGDTTDATPGSGTGGGEVGTRDEYVDAAQAQIPVEDEEMANCIAEAMVTEEVYAAIEEQGVTVDSFGQNGPAALSLDEQAASDAAPELAACGDLIEMLGGEADQQACVEDNLDNDEVAEILALSLFGHEATGELATAEDQVATCIEGLSAATTTT